MYQTRETREVMSEVFQ